MAAWLKRHVYLLLGLAATGGTVTAFVLIGIGLNNSLSPLQKNILSIQQYAVVSCENSGGTIRDQINRSNDAVHDALITAATALGASPLARTLRHDAARMRQIPVPTKAQCEQLGRDLLHFKLTKTKPFK